ncbi:MAG: hypothetical protein AB7O97_17535 [Planctomycetota bacterium]
MEQMWAQAWPFLPVAWLPTLALLVAPQLGGRGRCLLAAGFLLGSLALVADVVFVDHSGMTSLTVVNPFPRPPDGALHAWVVDEVTAPQWQWHLVPAGLFVVCAAVLYARRRRPPGLPASMWHCAVVFWFHGAMRLGLEATAAPAGLVWAAGSTPALVLILPFFAWWRARQGDSFGYLLRSLVWLGWLQRLPLAAFGYLASTRHLGTHLDTHLVTELWSPWEPVGLGFGDDAVLGWIWLTMLPQLTLWVALTLVGGMILGAVPWLIGHAGVRTGEAAEDDV